MVSPMPFCSDIVEPKENRSAHTSRFLCNISFNNKGAREQGDSPKHCTRKLRSHSLNYIATTRLQKQSEVLGQTNKVRVHQQVLLGKLTQVHILTIVYIAIITIVYIAIFIKIAIHMLLLTVAVFESGITEYSNFSVFSMIISVLNEHVFTDQKNKKRKSIV